MSTRPMSFGRVLVGAALFALAVAGDGSGPKPSGAVTAQTATAQRYYPEVRLRKLHLVRPDLIPYPIDFEVYC